MKNIFKFLGVALVASTMMIVACNPTDKNEENEDQNQQEETFESKITVKFGGSEWSYGQFTATLHADKDYMDCMIFQDSSDATKAFCAGYLGLTAKTYIDTIDHNTFSYSMNSDDSYIDYDKYLDTTTVYKYYGWMPMADGSQVTTAVDLNKKTISANYSGTLVNTSDYVAWYYKGTMQVADVRRSNLTVELDHAAWSEK